MGGLSWPMAAMGRDWHVQECLPDKAAFRKYPRVDGGSGQGIGRVHLWSSPINGSLQMLGLAAINSVILRNQMLKSIATQSMLAPFAHDVKVGATRAPLRHQPHALQSTIITLHHD